MKFKSIAAACVLGSAVVSLPAFADCTGPFTAPDLTFFLSGASGFDGYLKSVADTMFAGKTIYYFHDNADKSDKGYRAYKGTMAKAAGSVPAGTCVLLLKRSAGGSIHGVVDLARGLRSTVLDVSSGACSLISGTDYVCGTKGVDPNAANYDTAGAAGLIPDGGASDVGPAMFEGPDNAEYGLPTLSASEQAKLSTKAGFSSMMGYVTTLAVPASTTIVNAQYGAMLKGTYYDWSQVDPAINTGNTQVVVCRRFPGSGTQASYNWRFANFPCESASGGSVPLARMADSDGVTAYGGFGSGLIGSGTPADPYIVDPTFGYTVIENSGAGDVRSCLTAAQNHTDYTFTGEDGKTYKATFGQSSDPFRAIGVLSSDSAGKENGWGWRYMDGKGYYSIASQAADAALNGAVTPTGVAPSKANLISGAWSFAVEPTLQYRNAAAATNVFGDTAPALSGQKLDFFNAFTAAATDKANATANWIAALPPQNTPNAPLFDNNVARGTHYGNMCSPLQLLY
ncbi:MAG: hypothetical protein GC151_14150 [Betaproteobacteria bacterium]|nr:hypothetical protein [Betaproteobacteria bacterium]